MGTGGRHGGGRKVDKSKETREEEEMGRGEYGSGRRKKWGEKMRVREVKMRREEERVKGERKGT